METRTELVERASLLGVKTDGKTRKEIETEIKQMSGVDIDNKGADGLASGIAPPEPKPETEQKKKKTPTKYPHKIGHGITQLSSTGLSTGG